MWIIDRFEGDYAVIESENIVFNVPRAALPPDAAEGDCLKAEVDKETTAQRRSKMEDMMKKLFEN